MGCERGQSDYAREGVRGRAGKMRGKGKKIKASW